MILVFADDTTLNIVSEHVDGDSLLHIKPASIVEADARLLFIDESKTSVMKIMIGDIMHNTYERYVTFIGFMEYEQGGYDVVMEKLGKTPAEIIAELQEQVQTLTNENEGLQENVETLTSEVETLNDTVDSLNADVDEMTDCFNELGIE